MSIDMSQFYQVFFEESAEHLASMESLLLALDLDAPDPDQLNAIFRSAHSIKGGSGTFGFTDMTEVTHVLETLLDGIRKNEIAITPEMVDAFLQAGDVLSGLLEAHQNGTIADPDASEEIRARLEALTAEGSARSAGDTVPFAEKAAFLTTAQHRYRICFPCNADIFPREGQLESLLEEVRNVGSIDAQSMEGGQAELELVTQLSADALREIFSFFLDADQITLTPMEDVKEEDPGYGFFDDTVIADKEQEAGYGFFVEPEQIKADVEEAQGYGFFTEPAEIKADVEKAQGYGFFVEPSAEVSEPSAEALIDEEPKRRYTDNAPETAQRRASDKPAAETSIRVSVEKVDQMINLVGELVITQSMLAEAASHLDAVLHERLINGLVQLERITRELQESVMSVRMMPINFVFSRFPRLVRDLAGKLDKIVQLRLVGEGTELDKGLIEKISDPLTHLVRNSLDHGIEMPDERIAKGKDAMGTITLRAAHQGGNIVIEVTDDGAGLNREKILSKAREKGLPVTDAMSDAEDWQLIFAPGFSTAAVITDVSGRGVGMDVVIKNI